MIEHTRMNCLLEHEKRGFVVELPGERDEKFHFSWSKPRSEGLFMTELKARVMLKHPACPAGTYILVWDEVTKTYTKR